MTGSRLFATRPFFCYNYHTIKTKIYLNIVMKKNFWLQTIFLTSFVIFFLAMAPAQAVKSSDVGCCLVTGSDNKLKATETTYSECVAKAKNGIFLFSAGEKPSGSTDADGNETCTFNLDDSVSGGTAGDDSVSGGTASPTLPKFTKLTNPLGTTSIPVVIGRVVKAILLIIGSLAFLMFVYGGFVWMTAAGNEAKVETGRNTLIWATLGLIIIFSAYVLVKFLMEAIGAI